MDACAHPSFRSSSSWPRVRSSCHRRPPARPRPRCALPRRNRHRKPHRRERARRQRPRSSTRGQQVFGQHCAFCHGADARGGAQGGSDLLLSPIVLEDEGGAGLGKFLTVGRPEKNMPKFDLPRPQIVGLAAFLRARIGAASSSSRFKVDILVGDAEGGRGLLQRAGPVHDLPLGRPATSQRIGAKYEPVMLQGRMVVPRGRGGYPRRRATHGDLPLRATVTPPSGPARDRRRALSLRFLRDAEGRVRQAAHLRPPGRRAEGRDRRSAPRARRACCAR